MCVAPNIVHEVNPREVIQRLEELTGELQAELRARDNFLSMSEEDSKQHEKTIAVLNRQIAEKDNIIK